MFSKARRLAAQLSKAARDVDTALSNFEKAALAVEKSAPDEDLIVASKKVELANEIVSRGGVGRALVDRLVEHTQYWPSWIKRDDFENWVSFDGTNIEASERHEDREKIREVSFLFCAKKYRIVLIEHGVTMLPGDLLYTGEVEFWDGNKLVLKMSAYKSDGENPRWQAGRVLALRTGPWMKDLHRISSQIEVREQDKRDHFHNEQLKKIASNIEIKGD